MPIYQIIAKGTAPQAIVTEGANIKEAIEYYKKQYGSYHSAAMEIETDIESVTLVYEKDLDGAQYEIIDLFCRVDTLITAGMRAADTVKGMNSTKAMDICFLLEVIREQLDRIEMLNMPFENLKAKQD